MGLALFGMFWVPLIGSFGLVLAIEFISMQRSLPWLRTWMEWIVGSSCFILLSSMYHRPGEELVFVVTWLPAYTGYCFGLFALPHVLRRGETDPIA
ncbi:MAG TPA: hypothetical protein VMI31_12765 [Fimbriimonadaceae bacterium]|nr:hypothetical protein [Fimbriimonadaceae bacterium]